MDDNPNMAIPVVGAAGNVGRGVVEAFKKEGWEVLPIDPVINKTFDKLSDKEFRKIFISARIAIYTADCGNRDEYTRNMGLERENNERFCLFCKKVLDVNPNLTIWYIGGSWTKRKPNAKWEVNDNSANKDLKDCNLYEKAKISAEKNAQKLSRKTRIRFVDWPSIVPNLAPNFSITKMVIQAVEEGEISYSPGELGRPLADSVEAGEGMVALIKNDDQDKRFKKYLIPGSFISFTDFAQTVKGVVEAKTKKHIKLTEIENSPDFLKSKCKSDYLESNGFCVSRKRTLSALCKNAEAVWLSCYTTF
ncbi:NAD(P)-dependent oxidoreductase [Candidatus Microgenomates bacterium]|nr:MAG: NAD(P)-dependent oxidoreductase [Candidatus Microgenomates bacterium]